MTVGGRGGWLIDHSTHLCKRTSRFPLTTKRDTVRPAPTGSLWTVSQSSRRSSSECMAADANRLCPEYRAETTQGSSQDTWQRPPPRQSRIRARKHAASDVVDAEVSAEVRRASGSTNQEPRHRHQISADALLLRAVQGAEQQQARRGSVGDGGEVCVSAAFMGTTVTRRGSRRSTVSATRRGERKPGELGRRDNSASARITEEQR